MDINPNAVAQALSGCGQRPQLSLWQRFRKQSPSASCRFLEADAAATGLEPQIAELVWSNLMLHWHPAPEKVFAEWHRLLRTGGLAMFSYFAPFTCQEIRLALKEAGWQTLSMPFVDMHDVGDMLLKQGFVDPVMDQELITLTYQTPSDLLADLHALGGNGAVGRRRALPSRRMYHRLLAALEAQRDPQDGLLHLSIEVAYGHGWRGAVVQDGQTSYVSLDSLGGRALPSAGSRSRID